MKRTDKSNLISDLNSLFSSYDTFVVVHYKGLTVSKIEDLRKEATKNEVGFKVIKNTLASIATKDTKNSVLEDCFTGPTAIAWGNDPVACTKLVQDFAKENSDNFQIVAGSYNGQFLEKADVVTLSQLPSLDELRGKMVGLLTAAATKIAVLSKTPASNVVGVLTSYAKK